MVTLNEQIAALIKSGYRRPTAQAKVAHDVALLAMDRAGFKANSTIKGGVVMSSLTGDMRRATMDMDIDFIHHSISETSVRAFVRRLNRALPGVGLEIRGEVEDLRHEDYRGKRIILAVKDSSITRPLSTKMDIGVHTHEDIKQVDFSFEVTADSTHAELLANSPEQIFTEKLLSLLRHGALSNRPKDVFDMYYLLTRLNRKSLAILEFLRTL